MAVYALARVSQLFADRLPVLLIVILHVVPPAVFALAHGSVMYRVRGTLIFTGCCLGVAAFSESLSLRTGFPFGHYYFTDVMGPKAFSLPPLLVLAYLGVGYLSWILALLILRSHDRPLQGATIFAAPLTAAAVMLAWDLSMEPDWSTLDRAWVWEQGGAYFGVPLTNFFGWFLTAYVFYQLFAFYSARRRESPRASGVSDWRPAILFYAIVAVGNLLVAALPMAPPIVRDATGKEWMTAEIIKACGLVSLLVMLPIALLAWFRSRREFVAPRRAAVGVR